MTGGQMKENERHQGKTGVAEQMKGGKMGLPARSAAVTRRAGKLY
jgi:hypothetical protein